MIEVNVPAFFTMSGYDLKKMVAQFLGWTVKAGTSPVTQSLTDPRGKRKWEVRDSTQKLRGVYFDEKSAWRDVPNFPESVDAVLVELNQREFSFQFKAYGEEHVVTLNTGSNSFVVKIKKQTDLARGLCCLLCEAINLQEDLQVTLKEVDAVEK